MITDGGPHLIARKVPSSWEPDHPLRWEAADSQDPDGWASRGCSEEHALALCTCGAACAKAYRLLARQGRDGLPDMIAGSMYRLMIEHAPAGVDASVWSLDHGWLVKWVIHRGLQMRMTIALEVSP